MNAPAIIADVEPVVSIEEFEELCFDYVAWWRAGILDKIDAVDCVQHHAELWKMVDALGQDDVQRLMARAFALGVDVVSQEAPGEPEAAPTQGYRTPQSTVDAFLYVARNESTEYLARWLQQHPLDAQHLHKLWKQKCSTAPAI